MKKTMIGMVCTALLTGCAGTAVHLKESTSQKTPEVVYTESPQSFYQSGTINDYGWYMVSETYGQAEKIYNDFAMELLEQVMNEEGNDIISPLSLYMALSLLCDGTAGNTRLALENILGMNRDDLNAFMRDCILKAPDEGYAFENALWFDTFQKEVVLKDSFRQMVETYYGPVVYETDLKSDRNSAAAMINDMVSRNTDGMIDQVIDPIDITDETLFYLVNALAAGGRWGGPFDPDITLTQTFHNNDESESPVQMMHTSFIGYWDGENCEGFVKEPVDSNFRFVAIMPDEGIDIHDFVRDLDPEVLINMECQVYENFEENDILGIADMNVTDLAFPKFSYDMKYDLKETLQKMGLAELFEAGKADFTDMVDGNSEAVFVSDVFQKAEIEVNEEKVEASAATVVEGGLGAGAPQIREYLYHTITFDRPFVYALISNAHSLDGKILFLGVHTMSDMPSDNLIPIRITAEGRIRVRSGPSTSAQQYGLRAWPQEENMFVYPNQSFYAYEVKENEGYTWYRIGENAWIADQNGEWIEKI